MFLEVTITLVRTMSSFMRKDQTSNEMQIINKSIILLLLYRVVSGEECGEGFSLAPLPPLYLAYLWDLMRIDNERNTTKKG